MKNKKLLKKILIVAVATTLVFVGLFIFRNQATAPTEDKPVQALELNKEITNNNQLANPASENCEKLGGSLTIQTRGDDGQYGLCEFGEGMACEEWALYRNECPAGGVDISGLDSEIQMYCVWQGGTLDEINNNTCTLTDGGVCNTQELWNGVCPVN